MQTPFGQFRDICKMIKIEHSIFALPYAWAGSILAQRGIPNFKALIMLTIAMIAIRSFAMAFNRLVDLPFDKENPRTKNRPLVTGAISYNQTWLFCAFMALIFILSCYYINSICFYLSIPALLFSATYSLLKRITPLCHFWLGATLGLAPIAGWLSIEPNYLGMSPLLLFFAITFWVGAFDIYYAFQDMDYDKQAKLNSIPANYGSQSALLLAAFSHILTIIFLFLTGYASNLSILWYIIIFIIALILLLEHYLMSLKDLRYINTAFFTLNGFISPIVLIGIFFTL